MHFGNSPRTHETERRMAAWRAANPDATVPEYNRAYTTMWNSLERFSDKEIDAIQVAKAEYEASLSAEKEKLRGQEAKLLSGGKRPPRHRRPATKGAFGKGGRR